MLSNQQEEAEIHTNRTVEKSSAAFRQSQAGCLNLRHLSTGFRTAIAGVGTRFHDGIIAETLAALSALFANF